MVAVKAILNLDGKTDELKECRPRGDQGKEMSSSSAITYSVFSIKGITNTQRRYQTFSALFRDFLKHLIMNAQKVEVYAGDLRKKKKKKRETFDLKALLRRFCFTICYGVNYQGWPLLWGFSPLCFFLVLLQFYFP